MRIQGGVVLVCVLASSTATQPFGGTVWLSPSVISPFSAASGTRHTVR